MTSFEQMLDFMQDEDGFSSPLMPSEKHPEGKQYRIKSPSARTGLRLNALADLMAKREAGGTVSERDVERLRLDDSEEREFVEQVLGDALHEMVEDGCRWEHIKRMSTYAFIRFGVSAEAADNAVKNGLLLGKVIAPNRKAKRKQNKK